MKKILFVFLSMIITAISFGQSPTQINYQGVARNSVGNVLPNLAVTLRLSIHDGSAGGTVVYRETRAVTTNYFGLFNVAIGSAGATNVTGTIAGVNWGSGAKFLQVELDPAGGSTFLDMGTTQLNSVPYALFAGGGPPTGPAGGDLTGTFPNPTILLPFIKTQSVAANPLIGVTNSSTTGVLGAINGSSASTDANAVAIQGTISSTTPGAFSAALRGINNGTGGLGIGVWGSQNGSGWGVYGTSVSGIGVNGTSTSGPGVFGFSNTGNAGFFQNTNAANATNTVLVSNNGTADAMSVISTGTGSRAGFFQMNNAASTADALSAVTNGTGPSWALRGTSTGTNGAALFIVNNATSVANNVQSNHNGLGRAGLFSTTNAANTAATLEAIQTGTGFAGRFTSLNATPKALFTQGAIQLTANNEGLNKVLTSDAAGNAVWQNLSTIGAVSGTGTLNYVPKWTPNGTTLGNSQIFDNGFSVGIGTNIPNGAVKVDMVGTVAQVRLRDSDDNTEVWVSAPGAGYTGGIGTVTNHDFPLFTNSLDRLTVSANGNIGVGITTPGAKLDVLGITQANNTGGTPTYVATLGIRVHNTAAVTNDKVALNAYSNGASAQNVGVFTEVGTTGTLNSGFWGLINAAPTVGASYAIYGWDMINGPGTRAGFFLGNVDVVGTLSKSAGTFKIDHPLDPANKYLIHSFVESPDMMNVYNGNVKTDAEGRAVVKLPSYFEAENIDFKYQLTIVDETQFAMARIAKKISNNEFVILTDKPNIEVSWQVTGVRNDAYAKKYRIIPEVEKTLQDKGKFLHPTLFGQPVSKTIGTMPLIKSEQKIKEEAPKPAVLLSTQNQ